MAVLTKPDNTVKLVGNSVSGNDFTIKANAKSFKILSDGIYPNKILAVIRELSTNANDATIDAEKVSRFHSGDRNFPDDFLASEQENLNKYPDYNLSNWVKRKPTVHLPNRNEMWFSVRDYGTGLSPEFVQKLYTQYFFSNKTTSNDYVGCMGLGSKSPFCYTDNFSISSYWNGKVYNYAAYLEDGFPKINLVCVEDTDEPNGLLVTVNLLTVDDICKFSLEGKNVFIYFNELPEIIGNTLIKEEIEKIRNDIHSHDISCDDYYFNAMNSSLLAIMGNVVYPIAHNDIKTTLKNVIIRFNVGELDVTPSREYLSYDAKTIKAIQEKIRFVNDDIYNKCVSSVNDCKTYYDACCKYVDCINYLSSFGIFDSNITRTWNNLQLKTYMNITTTDCLEFCGNKDRRSIVDFVIYYSKDAHSYIIEDDTNESVGFVCKCKYYSLNKNGKKIYLIKSEDIDNVKQQIGLPKEFNFTKLSSLPKPPKKVPTSRTATTKQNLLLYKCEYFNERTPIHRFWDTCFTKPTSGIYVKINGRNKLYNDDKHPYEILNLIRSINKFVYGVKDDSVLDKSKWQSLDEYCISLIKEVDVYNDVITESQCSNSKLPIFSKILECSDKLKTENEFYLKYKRYRDLYLRIYKYTNYKPQKNKNALSISKIIKDINEKYPMIYLLMNNMSISNNFSKEEKNIIKEYLSK